MITYYTIVDSKTKRRVQWKKGQPGYGWPTQPHRMMELLKKLEDSFQDGDKLVMRQTIDGSKPRLDFLTFEEARADIPLRAESYLTEHPELNSDRLMKSTLAILEGMRAKDAERKLQRAAK